MVNTLKGRVRKVSLEFMGEEWSEAYVEFRYLTWGDALAEKQRNEGKVVNGDAYLDQAMQTLKMAFVAGKSLNGQGDLVDLSLDDLEAFDIDALLNMYQRVLGVPDPNV